MLDALAQEPGRIDRSVGRWVAVWWGSPVFWSSWTSRNVAAKKQPRRNISRCCWYNHALRRL